MNIGKKDVLWGYISLLLVQGINVILLPVIVRYLNFAELGVWYTFTSLYGLAMLIDFGFQTIITRNISYLWSGAQSIKSIGFEVVGDIDKNKSTLFYQSSFSCEIYIYVYGWDYFYIIYHRWNLVYG